MKTRNTLYCVMFIIFFFAANFLFAQTPDNLGTNMVNGTNTSYTMTNLGKFNQTRLQATASAVTGTDNWEFFSCSVSCGLYNWQPTVAGRTIAGYNQDIVPVAGTASATYNTGSGGFYGYLPAITANSYYTFNVMNNSAVNNDMGVLQTTFNPVNISSVKSSTGCSSVTVTATLSATPGSGEYFYVRWSTNSFATSAVSLMTVTGTTAKGSIPVASGSVQFYVFSSSINTLVTTGKTEAYYDVQTLNLNNNSGSYYSFTFGGPLSGAYTVNNTLPTGGTNFNTLAEAVNELDNRGISSSVIFNVSAGLTETAPTGGYLLQYCSSLAAANLSSATQTVTFQKSGAGADPLVSAQAGTSLSSDAIFSISGAKYITITGIDLIDNNTLNATTEMEAGYALLQQSTTNGTQNITIQNCTITLHSNYDASLQPYNLGPACIMTEYVGYGAYTTQIIPSSIANACNNNSFLNNSLQNCSFGVACNRFSSNPGNYCQNNTIANNTIQNFNSNPGSSYYAGGIYASYQNSLTVSNNIINNIAGGGTPAACNILGIYIGGYDGIVGINNNTISLTMPFNLYGQEMMCIGTYGTASTISGNIIQGCTMASGNYGPFYGIFNGGVATSLTISNNVIGSSGNPNTIQTSGSSTTAYINFIVNQQSASTSVINITGNTIQSNAVTTGNNVEFIANQGTCTTLTVAGNSINNNTVSIANNASTIWGLLNMNTVSGALTFGSTGSGNGNTFQNNAFNTIGYIYFMDPTDLGTLTSGSESIVNNTILSNTNNAARTRPVYLLYNNTPTNNITAGSNVFGNSTTPAFTETGACTGDFYGYSNNGTATGGTESITSNTLNVSLKTSGNAKGFYSNTSTSQTGTITGNIISNFINTGTGTFTVFDFESHSTTSAFNNNSIAGSSSLSSTGGVSDYGFYILAPVQNIFLNAVSGVTLTAASNANFFPLYISNASATSPSSVYNNSVNSITTSGTNYINAIQINQTVANCNVYGNTVNSLSGNPTQIGGILLNNSGGITNCYQNNIYNLASSNTNAIVAGIDAVGGTTNNIYNNLVSDLRATAATSTTTLSIRGLQVDGGTNTGIYYNTIYLNAISSGTNFGTAALFVNSATTNLTLENNILANNSTSHGTEASVALQTIYAIAPGTSPSISVYASASDHNDFYTTSSGYAYADNLPIAFANNKFQCTCSNITAFKSYIAAREANSFYELPPFTNISTTPYNLSLPTGASTSCYQGGVPITSITTNDFAGTTRSNSLPTVGAYEMPSGTIADKVAPTISFTPAAANCNSNVTFTATITDAGTGVNTASPNMPRVYYKKQSDANNNLATVNNSTMTGWKYITTASTSSPYSFTIDLSLLNGTIAQGDVIQYFVVAQDKQTVPNVAVSGAALSNCITSVVLTSANFPATGITNNFTIPPFPQNAAITPSSATVCEGGVQPLTASVSNVSPSPTITWSPVSNLYTDAATTSPYTTGTNAQTVYTNTSASISYTATITIGTCSTTVTVPVITGPNMWTGTMSNDWNVGGNWCAGIVPTNVTDVVIPNTATNQPVIGLSGANAFCKTLLIQSGASMTMQNSFMVTISNGGTFTNSGTFISGSANETVLFAGSGSITGVTTFNNLAISGNVLLNNSITVNKTATLNAGNALTLNSNTLTLAGTVSGTGTITGDNNSVLNISGNVNTSLGTLYFTPGAQMLNTLSIDRWNGSIPSNAVTLGSNLSANNISLLHGILSTNTNLLILNAYSGLTISGGVPWSISQNNNYTLSYIATCDNAGTPVSVSNATTPLGAYGFQINNIGIGGTTGDVYFPVGASYLPAGTNVMNPSPNRIMINNQGPADNFNAVVNYGDISNTPNARINRIWYVHSANSTSSSSPDRVTMKLFFVERNVADWPVKENEIENFANPFDFTHIILVERDYNSLDGNFISISSGSDVQTFPYGANQGKEVYSQYSVGVSPDLSGNAYGIYEFNRFSITNPGTIILPVTFISYTASLQNNKVLNDWATANEINLDHFEVERSADAINFTAIGSVPAKNNGQINSYSFTNNNPLTGKSFYRIKAVNKDGSFVYTNVQLIIADVTAQSISIFPNPVVNNIFVVEMNNVQGGKYTLRIFNAQAQQIVNKEIFVSGTSQSQNVQLPASTAKGEYFINISGTGGEFYRKINVQ